MMTCQPYPPTLVSHLSGLNRSERIVGGTRHEHAERAALRARRQRPSGYTAADKCDEFPPPHGLTPRPRITD